jgi:hypothetical protein
LQNYLVPFIRVRVTHVDPLLSARLTVQTS